MAARLANYLSWRVPVTVGKSLPRLVLLAVAGLVLLPIVVERRWSPEGTADEIVVQIAWRHAHGWPERELSPDEMSRRAVDGPVVATCGYVSAWAVELLRTQGYEARVVTTYTLEEPNGWNDGHTFIEVWQDGWIAYDIDRDLQPTVAGRGISAAEWVARVPSGAYDIRPLSYPLQEHDIRAMDRRVLGRL